MSAPTLACPDCGAPVRRFMAQGGREWLICDGPECPYVEQIQPAAVEVAKAGAARLPGFGEAEGED